MQIRINKTKAIAYIYLFIYFNVQQQHKLFFLYTYMSFASNSVDFNANDSTSDSHIAAVIVKEIDDNVCQNAKCTDPIFYPGQMVVYRVERDPETHIIKDGWGGERMVQTNRLRTYHYGQCYRDYTNETYDAFKTRIVPPMRNIHSSSVSYDEEEEKIVDRHPFLYEMYKMYHRESVGMEYSPVMSVTDDEMPSAVITCTVEVFEHDGKQQENKSKLGNKAVVPLLDTAIWHAKMFGQLLELFSAVDITIKLSSVDENHYTIASMLSRGKSFPVVDLKNPCCVWANIIEQRAGTVRVRFIIFQRLAENELMNLFYRFTDRRRQHAWRDISTSSEVNAADADSFHTVFMKHYASLKADLHEVISKITTMDVTSPELKAEKLKAESWRSVVSVVFSSPVSTVDFEPVRMLTQRVVMTINSQKASGERDSYILYRQSNNLALLAVRAVASDFDLPIEVRHKDDTVRDLESRHIITSSKSEHALVKIVNTMTDAK